jgi:hypothetical protein
MTSKNFLFMGAVLAVGGLLAVPGCGDDTTDTTTATTTGTTTTTTTTTTTGTGGGGGAGGGAGGTGGGAVAPTCADYCGDIMANCTNDNQQYTTEADCMATCVAFDTGVLDAMQGDTLGCRQYHAGVPATMDAALHCPHAGPLGGGVCGADPCQAFCQIATTLCTEVDTGWADEAACAAECAGFPTLDMVPYNATVVSGDSLACRMYHLQVASNMPAPHCTHINEASTPCQ